MSSSDRLREPLAKYQPADRPPAHVLSEMFGSGDVVPSQYCDSVRRSVCLDGEHRLMLAVLETAIFDYLQASASRNHDERRRAAEVSAWIDGRYRSTGIFAYEEVCENLGIDPNRLRKGLVELRQRSVVRRLRLERSRTVYRPLSPARRRRGSRGGTR
jgi:hypothetical protein